MIEKIQTDLEANFMVMRIEIKAGLTMWQK